MARLCGAGARTDGWASADRTAGDAGDRGAQHLRGTRRDLTGGPGQPPPAHLLREVSAEEEKSSGLLGSRVSPPSAPPPTHLQPFFNSSDDRDCKVGRGSAVQPLPSKCPIASAFLALRAVT